MATSTLQSITDTDWAYVLTLLPADLDKLARDTGAIQRMRSITSGEQLLHLVLASATADWTYRQTAAMLPMWGGPEISDVALLKRLRGCPAFLRALISAVLARRVQSAVRPDAKVCLVDGSSISAPGSRKADWRLHVSYDLREQQLLEVELTEATDGESMTRLKIEKDRIYVADRGFGTTPEILYLLSAGAQFVVRITPQNIRLRTTRGTPFKALDWLQSLPEAKAGQCSVICEGYPHPVRLVAVRKNPEAARRARRAAEREGRRKGGTVRPATLELADYILVLTNCEDMLPDQVLELYSFRWQIELAFKRLKSLLHLDHLRAHDPNLAQTYLLGKILSALLLEDMTVRAVLFSPWGYQLQSSAT
jgi:hypothetical protein